MPSLKVVVCRFDRGLELHISPLPDHGRPCIIVCSSVVISYILVPGCPGDFFPTLAKSIHNM